MRDRFDDIFDMNYETLYFFILKHVKDHEAANDIAIEAFSELLKKDHSDYTNEQIRGYLFITAKCRMCNYINYQKRSHHNYEDIRQEDENIPTLHLQDEIEFTELKVNVLKALREISFSLPKRLRLVYEGMYIEGLNYKEFTLKYKWNINTLRNQHNRLLGILKERYHKKYNYSL